MVIVSDHVTNSEYFSASATVTDSITIGFAIQMSVHDHIIPDIETEYKKALQRPTMVTA